MTQSAVEYPKTDSAEKIKTAPMLILHVDDDANFLKTAKSILEMQGAFKVDTASSVEEAIEKMKQKTYASIVCDYVMPEKDGLQFLKELRQKDNRVPFFIFTGKGREDLAIKALNLGADGYFSKIGHPETVYGELAHGIRRAVERKKTEMEIWRREERLRAILASSPDVIIISDLNGNIVDCNDATLRLSGHSSKEELLGKSSFEFIVEKDRERAMQSLKKALEQKTMKNIEYTLRKKNGEEYIGELSASILKDSVGKPVGFVGVIRDVTERKKTEEALKESEERYRSMVEQAPDLIVTIDEKGIVTSCNSAAEDSGYSKEEIIGKHFLDSPLTRGIDATYAQELFNSIFEGKALEPIEVAWYHKDGTSRLSEIRISLMKNEGKTAGFTAIARDITERKRTEQELARSEEKYKSLVELAPNSIMTFDLKGVITSINSASTRLSGYSKDELVGKHFTKIGVVRARDIPKYLQMLSSTLRGTAPKPFEVTYHHKDGTPRLGEVHVSFIKEMGKTVGLQAVMRDITESKKAGEALRESEQRFRCLVEDAFVSIAIANAKGQLTYVNKTTADMLGYSQSEMVGQPFVNFLHPDDKGKIMRMFLKSILLRIRPRILEFRLVHKDGHVFNMISKPTRFVIEGKTVGFQAISVDISERQKTLEKLKVLNEKLGVVGKLTRHDIRNKLSAVTNNIFLAKQTLPNGHKALTYLGDIESVCQQSTRILDFATTYEKLGVEELLNSDVGKSVDEAVMLMQLQGVKVTNECHGLTVMADSLLRQLFYNLIDNSLRHGKKVSQIKVHYKEEKNELKLVYEDDGVGIPKAEKKKIFEGKSGTGMGHGLFMIRKICEVYRWSIRETGTQGKRAQFTITIPKANISSKTNDPTVQQPISLSSK